MFLEFYDRECPHCLKMAELVSHLKRETVIDIEQFLRGGFGIGFERFIGFCLIAMIFLKLLLAVLCNRLKIEIEHEISTSKIPVEENPKLAYKFNVINLPTFIIYRNGKKVKTLVAFRRKKSYYHY